MERKTAFSRLISALVALAFAPTLSAAAPAAKDVRIWKPSKGNPEASCHVKFKLEDPAVNFTFKIAAKDKKQQTWTFRTQMGSEQLPKFWMSYTEYRMQQKLNPKFSIPYTTFENASLQLKGAINLEWWSFPKFAYYDFDFAKSQSGKWEKTRQYAYQEDFDLNVRHVPGGKDVDFFLNGQYIATWHGCGKLTSISVFGVQPVLKSLSTDEDDLDDVTLEEDGPKCEFVEYNYQPTAEYMLESHTTNHASPLMKGAKLSIKPGLVEFPECKMLVWPAEKSLDQGLHRKLNSVGDLFEDMYFNRNGWASGVAEYMDFTVPSRTYSHCWVLFADIPQKGKNPALGIMVTRWTNLGMASIANGGLFGLEDPVKAGCRKVGEVTYQEGGKTKTAPLWLGRGEWDSGKILDLMQDAPIYGAVDPKTKKRGYLDRGQQHKNLRYLDFELCGCGGYTSERSSIQVFGCSLMEAPWQIGLAQSESGNIFADDEKPETSFDMTSLRDGEKGAIEYEIFDPYFKHMDKRRVDFTCAKAGEPVRVTLDLSMPKVGWYGMYVDFKNAAGDIVFRHEAAFALLGKDTREAGFESPYAAWPQLTTPSNADGTVDKRDPDTVVVGRHNTNPDRKTVFKMMHKAGFHKSWYDYALDENEFPDYKWTMSMFPIGNPPDKLASQKDLDDAIEEEMTRVRNWHRRFPHCKMVMLLHETGGKGLAEEVVGKPAVQGEYRGLAGNIVVCWMTEFVKRLKKEFPDFTTQIGNGSSSSEKVAELARAGLDLKLFEYMGIESKGFQSMPEERANLESPGMGWALRETARVFGHEKAKVTPCGEYVFRPEREVRPTGDFMWRTRYVLRDYLVSLCFGALNISHGHIEDCRSNYYNTNWGAGGLCEVFPYSYPKRAYVAVATLTKALDKPKYLGSVDDGALSVYTEEFLRERRVPDYAYALWTPWRDAQVAFTFPEGTKLEAVNPFGDSFEPKPGKDGKVVLKVGGMPRYLIASQRCLKAEARVSRAVTPAGCRDEVIWRPQFENSCPVRDHSRGDYWPRQGTFDIVNATDPDLGAVAEIRLVKTMKKVPQIVTEYTTVKPNDPVVFRAPGKDESVGLWFRANGTWDTSYAKIKYKDEKGKTHVEDRGNVYENFDGWCYMNLAENGNAGGGDMELLSVSIASARTALNPQEMEPVAVQPVLGPLVHRIGKSQPEKQPENPDADDPRFSAVWQNLDINIKHR